MSWASWSWPRLTATSSARWPRRLTASRSMFGAQSRTWNQFSLTYYFLSKMRRLWLQFVKWVPFSRSFSNIYRCICHQMIVRCLVCLYLKKIPLSETLRRQFHQHFTCPFFLRKCFFCLNVTRKKLPKRIVYKKRERKTLMKLTAGVVHEVTVVKQSGQRFLMDNLKAKQEKV